MHTTIVGLVADQLGLAVRRWLEPGRNHPELRRHYFAVPGGGYRRDQPADIPLQVDHAGFVGRVRHLERTVDGDLWMVAEVTAPPASIPANAVYLSPTVDYTELPGTAVATDVELRSLSLTADPATSFARPVHELVGDLQHACRNSWRLRNPFLTALLEHARDNKAGTSQVHERHRPPPESARPVERRADAVVVPSGPPVRLPPGTEMYYSAPYRGGILSVH